MPRGRRPQTPVTPVTFDQALAAIQAGDIEAVRTLVRADPSVLHLRAEATPPLGCFSGATLLHYVAGNPAWKDTSHFGANTVVIAEAMLYAGADVHATTLGPPASTTMALVLTSRQASEAGISGGLIDVLLAHGAPLDLSDASVLDAPLSNHAPGAALALVARGAPLDVCAAAALGDLGRVQAAFDAGGGLRERVVRRGRELSAREAVGLALLFAYVNGQAAVVDALLERDGDWDATGVLNGTALHLAAQSGDLVMVQRLVARGANASDRRNPFGSTPFGWAVHNGKHHVAAWLRAQGLVDLHDAVAHDLVDQVEARLRDDPSAVNQRLDHGGIPQGTPLHYAAARNRPLVARLLLANGANPNATDGIGCTPLDRASGGASGVAAILVQHGARRART
jgi:ankyrin repeat protein